MGVVGSDRQGTGIAVTWKLPLDMGSLQYIKVVVCVKVLLSANDPRMLIICFEQLGFLGKPKKPNPIQG